MILFMVVVNGIYHAAKQIMKIRIEKRMRWKYCFDVAVSVEIKEAKIM